MGNVSGVKAMIESLVRTFVQVAIPLVVAWAVEAIGDLDYSWTTSAWWVAIGAPIVAALMRKVFPTITDRPGDGRTDLRPKATPTP